jgi:quercetin dioxygenase-like cupin family protein
VRVGRRHQYAVTNNDLSNMTPTTTDGPTPLAPTYSAPTYSAPTYSATTTRRAAIIAPGGGHSVRAFGNEILFKLTAEQAAGALSLGLATVPVGNGPPPHLHEREDELFIILEGQYRVFADGEWAEAGPGSVVFLPRGGVHTFHVVGPQPGRHWVLTTSGDFERFYAQCGEVFAQPGPPDRARLAGIAAENGQRLVAPAGDGAR